MKLSIVRGGGLAGMVTRTELASEALSEDDARKLREKVEQAGLLAMPESLPPAEAHPDELNYELTVEHEGRERTVRLSESTLPEEVRSLIAWADSVPEREHRIEPPGGP
jgi:hypothetical protein